MFQFNGKTFYASQSPGQALGPNDVLIESMTGPQLLETFNLVAANLGRGRVKRFADPATGRKRLIAILTDYASQDDAGTATDPPAADPPIAAPEPGKAKTERKKRGMRFVFPAEKDIKPVREGTARAKALAILTRDGGGTFDDVCRATGWNEKKAYEGIRLLHYYSGYGLKEKVVDGKTIITAHK